MGQIFHLQKDVNGMGAVRRGGRLTRIGVTALAAATVAMGAMGAMGAYSAGTASAATQAAVAGQGNGARGLDRAERLPVREFVGCRRQVGAAAAGGAEV